jgi:hypothetical protein
MTDEKNFINLVFFFFLLVDKGEDRTLPGNFAQ